LVLSDKQILQQIHLQAARSYPEIRLARFMFQAKMLLKLSALRKWSLEMLAAVKDKTLFNL
tara:strand:- start:703 stop:885 length:183 start_codon:yes stop_codon:yes gene_type:complete